MREMLLEILMFYQCQDARAKRRFRDVVAIDLREELKMPQVINIYPSENAGQALPTPNASLLWC